MKVIVMKGRVYKTVEHVTVPVKGAKDPYCVSKVRAVLGEWGKTEVAMKSVQGPATIDLKRAARESR